MRTQTLLLPLVFILFLSCEAPIESVFINYEQNREKIAAAVQYFTKIQPASLSLYIRFNSKTNIDLVLNQKNYKDKASWINSYLFDKYGQFSKYNISLDDPETKVILAELSIRKEDVVTLWKYLDEATCKSISNHFGFRKNKTLDHTSLGYRHPTDDSYVLDYLIFENELDNNIINEVTRQCDFKKINTKVLVKYSAPSFGSDCFPDKR